MNVAPAESNLAETDEARIDAGSINRDYLADEEAIMSDLLERARTSPSLSGTVHNTAANLVENVRDRQKQSSGLHAFLNHYDLSSREGIVLMCLAEALLRIPDSDTMDKLIAEKLSAGNWEKHVGESESFFVNASTWALMLTGKILEIPLDQSRDSLKKLFNRLEEPVIRAAVKTAMGIMAFQFVMGRNIEEAVRRSQKKENRLYRYSFDMLGEAALTMQDADRYQTAYANAISSIGNHLGDAEPLMARPGISVKLSALHPRYEYTQKERACHELSERLLELASLAKQAGIGLTVDAEEADRLELSLMIFANVYHAPELHGWDGLGLAVQAYQKRALPVLHWLNALSRQHGKVIPVRLVKGAYWDTEIKHAQELGLKDYPVFTRKCNTDVSYLACVRYLLDECKNIYPQFATHNAHTLAYVYHHAKNRDYEFQRLHGMGEELYTGVVGADNFNVPCRVYAPVGAHEDLLPYLVRRLLENGANTSFVNQIVHKDRSIEAIITDPIEMVEQLDNGIRHPNIPLPSNLFGKERLNSSGINFADPNELGPLLEAMRQNGWEERSVTPVINGEVCPGTKSVSNNPFNTKSIGHVDYANRKSIEQAIEVAHRAWPDWNNTPVQERADMLEKAADLYQQHHTELMALCVLEAGKTLPDSHAEIREAIDFLRYYAAQAKNNFPAPVQLPGPTGESNELRMDGRGVFLCISPWNFPVAIYTGQIAAALVTGNTVIAKPAEQTSLVAGLAARLMHKAGIPHSVLQFVPAEGALVGATALADPRIAGVAFTGSTDTARIINQTLADRPGPIAALIAETGGQNAMIVDSSALPEQVVTDVIQSAFNSAGQRCSALRVLYLQEDTADRSIDLLKGYMDEMVIGDPLELTTDIGPVIDREAKQTLEQHINHVDKIGKIIYQCRLPDTTRQGYFVPPTVIEIANISQLDKENFGPVLHIIRYRANELEKIINEINNSDFGLTLGIHTRIEQRAEWIRKHARVGNVYVNRNMVGAVVGVQPFGGRGLSGTGPKAGGPNYLHRFITEQTYTVNTAAVGGNASLLTLTGS